MVDFEPSVSRGRHLVAAMVMVGALTFAPSFQAMSQDLPLDVEIDIAMAALEQAMSSESHSETLVQIDLIRELDPELAAGELLFFEALAAKAVGDVPRADTALTRFLSDVGRQSASYDEALAMAIELRAINAEASAAEEGIAAYEAEDYATALAILEPLAEANDSSAQYYLGKLRAAGKGGAQDVTEAGRLYRQAAEAGYAPAQAALASFVAIGDGGMERDLGQAVHWYRLSAEQGDAGGQAELAGHYLRGDGIAQDLAQAVHWYQLSAEAGHPWGMVGLGRMYRDGLGVEQDFTEAFRLFRSAVSIEKVSGSGDLAGMYALGLGVSKDETEALRLYRQAIAGGALTYEFQAGNIKNRVATSGEWHLAEVDGNCSIFTRPTLSSVYPGRSQSIMHFALYSTFGTLQYSVVHPSPFDANMPVEARIDGKRFPLVAGRSFLEPQDGGSFVRAIRAGQTITVSGTDKHGGQPISVTFSAIGFTQAFKSMAERCDKPGIMSLIQ